jgi:hypothetical protein
VAAIGTAATVDALDFGARPSKPAVPAGPGARPATTEAQASIPECARTQLAFSIRIIEKTPVAVLRHVRGDLCRQPSTPVRVRLAAARGKPNGDLLGPEGALDGLYLPGYEERVAFRYRPTCVEDGPFRAFVRAGPYTATRIIPVDPGCFPLVQRHVVRLGGGRTQRSFSVEAPNPAKHGLVVRVVLPHRARVDVTIEDTTSGPVIQVLDRARRRHWCRRQGRKDVCKLDFGALEAESPGRCPRPQAVVGADDGARRDSLRGARVSARLLVSITWVSRSGLRGRAGGLARSAPEARGARPGRRAQLLLHLAQPRPGA